MWSKGQWKTTHKAHPREINMLNALSFIFEVPIIRVCGNLIFNSFILIWIISVDTRNSELEHKNPVGLLYIPYALRTNDMPATNVMSLDINKQLLFI